MPPRHHYSCEAWQPLTLALTSYPPSPLANGTVKAYGACTMCTPQVKALHLDVEFLKFDKASVQGILPELWGLAPISGDTKQVLSPQ